jgi:glutamate synthase domain-containing protein 3
MDIYAGNLDFQELNRRIRGTEENVRITGCLGQRFVGAGMRGKSIFIQGTPGNALGAYLDGAEIHVMGNAQDAVGDTMNGGRIVIHGNAGDALGYAMRGGSIYVWGDAGYRTGIHMKEYREHRPAIVVGGRAGSFLGEYLAGGLIIVLGMGIERPPVGSFIGTGMHGGSIFIRTQEELTGLPAQVSAEVADGEMLEEIRPYVSEFCTHFGENADKLLKDRYYRLKANARNPYRQLYTTE